MNPCIFECDGFQCVCRMCLRTVATSSSSSSIFARCRKPSESRGPGTELKKLLAGWPFRLVAGADCKCNQRAAYMDSQGCEWVASNIEECVGYLRESAADRGLPFLDIAGRVLVRRAIANARRKEQARAKEAKAEGGAAAG